MRLHIIKANNLIKNRVVSLVSLSTWYEKSISIHNPSSLQFRIRSWSAATLSFKSLSRTVFTREGNRQVFFFFFQATTDTRYFVAQPSDNNVTVSTVFSLPPLLSSSSSSLPPFSFLSFSPPSPLSPPHPPSIDYRYPIGGFHEA